LYYYSYATTAPATPPVKPKHHHVHIPKTVGKRTPSPFTNPNPNLDLPPGPSFPKFGNPLEGPWKWLQGYSPYLFIGGLFLWFISHKSSGWLAAILYFTAYGLMIVGGLMFISNFGGVTNIPDIGMSIRKAINPNAN
jgi:hypothetical protein